MRNPKSSTHIHSLIVLFITLAPFAAVSAEPIESARYVGRSACASCHAEQLEEWSGSHHDLSMQRATAQTVLGNFDNAEFSYFGVTSTFFRRGDAFMARTEGPDGQLRDYQVRYTFGVSPLQQYLVEFPGGRLQALPIAWDARPKEQGGQRWFHLYPGERIGPNNELHWTGLNQNWNYMCAECHSTNLEKGYDPATRTFATTWSEIDVSCEACHGPSSKHLTWARRESGWEALDPGKGLALVLDERKGIEWPLDPETGTASRSRARESDREIEMCARCHSLRSTISPRYVHGEPLLDHYRPRLLDEGMYHVDGQIDGEVYVYGSLVQSKMYHAGVTCSDCHKPHSLALKAPGNGVCMQCHLGAKYDQASHHFHDNRAASCADCHMPPKRYMVIDPRHDHSMRIPRPDLSVRLGTPNACNNCHEDKDAGWAAAKLKAWYGAHPRGYQDYADALHAARHDAPGAAGGLRKLARDTSAPAIARASAMAALGAILSPATVDALAAGLSDKSPMIRHAALLSLEQLPAPLRVSHGTSLLDDPVRAVRIEAARVLADISEGWLSSSQRLNLRTAIEEYRQAQLANAERPESQTNLGTLYARLGQAQKAVSAYRAATELDPAFMPAYVNLADLHRLQGDEVQAEAALRQAAAVAPSNAIVHHALGLSLVRQRRLPEALEALQLATTLAPQNAQYAYVYAVALNSTGRSERAIRILETVHQRHPANRDVLEALAAFNRDAGKISAARHYAEKLRALK
ncbi:MAG: tetratricopeptide repeat protein [Hyphomicrobium sp.]